MSLKIELESYIEQVNRWPKSGNSVLASFDETTVIVYQAFRPEIACFALHNQFFGGEFSYARMSWIKPGFLWMMFRSGWATKVGQEYILAVHLKRTFFDKIVSVAVPANFDPEKYTNLSEWKEDIVSSDVRIQWDPDHDPTGKPVKRRALQIGLRGNALRAYGENINSIQDVTSIAKLGRLHAHGNFESLMIPSESVYPREAPDRGSGKQWDSRAPDSHF